MVYNMSVGQPHNFDVHLHYLLSLTNKVVHVKLGPNINIGFIFGWQLYFFLDCYIHSTAHHY